MFSALDVVKETGLYSLGMPNRWNISLNYYYTLCLSLPVYVIAFPQLYSHMFRQVSDTSPITVNPLFRERKFLERSKKSNEKNYHYLSTAQSNSSIIHMLIIQSLIDCSIKTQFAKYLFTAEDNT